MAEQSYEVNEDAIDAAAYTMVGTHHPDRVTQMRNIVANYLVALRTIDEEAAGAALAVPPGATSAMPSTSAAQARLMSAVAHGWKPDKAKVPLSVAQEYHSADKKQGKYIHASKPDRLLAQGKRS